MAVRPLPESKTAIISQGEAPGARITIVDKTVSPVNNSFAAVVAEFLTFAPLFC